MTYKIENKLIKKHIVDNVGVFYYYDNFMIAELNEGIIVDINAVLKVTNEYTMKYYNVEKPFVYISNRINSYSIKPTVHLETRKLSPNAIGYAVVSNNPMNIEVVAVEKIFLNIPARIFNSIEDAVTWANYLIKKH